MTKPEDNESDLHKNRERAEGLYTALRIFELELDPVRGIFDATHLREINRRIFQDLPGLGFKDVTLGLYRPPVLAGQDWLKNRQLDSVGGNSLVAYSAMNLEAIERLDKVLNEIRQHELSELNATNFSKAIATLYGELDYIHPFPDGNSRTLRTFTKQLAHASGYQLDWARFNQSPSDRDMLYIARDKTVNQIAFPVLSSESTMRRITISMHQFSANKDLSELLRDVIQPNKKITGNDSASE